MKNPIGIIVFIYVIIHFNSNALSQIESEKDTQFFNFLYDFQFSKADSLLATIDSIQEPSHFNFLKSHYMRWYYLPIHQQSEGVLSQYNQHLTAIDEEGSEAWNYLFINSALLKAEFNYNQGNYYKSFQNGAKVYDLVKGHLENKPRQVEIKFLVSLYHYYYQYYKSENSVFGTLMSIFKEGNKEIGLKWLEEVAEEENIIQTEALIYLSHIYLRLENNIQKAYYYTEMLHQKFPNNPKFYELMIECSLANDMRNAMVKDLIHEMKHENKIYFQKYGVCYDAILMAKFGNNSQNEKLEVLKEALLFIQNNGGGNHLSSLLYFNLFELSGNNDYLIQKNSIEEYKYVLTGYSNEQGN